MLVLLLVLFVPLVLGEDCVLNLPLDAPWVVDQDFNFFHLTSDATNITIKAGAKFYMKCLNGTTTSLFSDDGDMFMCIGGTSLFLPTTGEVVDYNKIICKNNPPVHAIRKLTQTCANNFTLIEAGLTIGTTFSPAYTVCFDDTLLSPFYVEFTKPLYNCSGSCGSTLRLHVDAGSLYNVDLDLIYIRQETIFKNLDLEASFKPLQQVSLVDNQLFVNPARWYPTFDYANHVFNWASFDGTPSDFCFNYLPASSVVYAGVLGVAKVSNSQGKLVEVYLNDGTVPVPQWYWCVFYDKSPQVDGVFFVQYTAMMATATSSSGAQVLWQNEICSEDTYVYNDQLGEFYGNCTFSGLVNPLLINFVDEKWPQARAKSQILLT